MPNNQYDLGLHRFNRFIGHWDLDIGYYFTLLEEVVVEEIQETKINRAQEHRDDDGQDDHDHGHADSFLHGRPVDTAEFGAGFRKECNKAVHWDI